MSRSDQADIAAIKTLDWSIPDISGVEHLKLVESGRQWNAIVKNRRDLNSSQSQRLQKPRNPKLNMET